MKDKLTLLFLCILVLAQAQDGCQQSRLDKMQSGLIILNPNDLGAAGANKNYYQSLSRANFGPTDFLGYAVAIAGFETSCGQAAYSLLVDIVEPQNQNTKLRIVVDFRNKGQSLLTSWTKVKLTYLVTSAQKYPNAALSGTSYVWATSQYIDLSSGPITNAAIFTDPILYGTGALTGAGIRDCGLKYTTAYTFGFACDTTAAGGNGADKDVALHAYIMGFQYEPDTANTNQYLASTVIWGDGWFADDKKMQLAFFGDGTYTDRATINTAYTTDHATNAYGIQLKFDAVNLRGGPSFLIATQNSELKGIKVALVMTVINSVQTVGGVTVSPKNGIAATALGYSYSGLYTPYDQLKYGIKTYIDDDAYTGYNNLKTKLPSLKYAIYGFSSFSLDDGSGCTSISLDVTIDTVNSLTVSTNLKTFMKSVVVQADLYFPQLASVCSPGIDFNAISITTAVANAGGVTLPQTLTRSAQFIAATSLTTPTPANLKWMKSRDSQKYQTFPSDNQFQYIRQQSDNPLNLLFVVRSKVATATYTGQYVRMNAEVNITGITSGKPYGMHFVLVPQTSKATPFFQAAPNSGKYQFKVGVNGLTIYQSAKTEVEMNVFGAGYGTRAAFEQKYFGVNLQGSTATFTFNVTVPRDTSSDTVVQNYQIIINLFEFQQVYDPTTQCCTTSCPTQNGLDVLTTPAACVVCDTSKGLTFDPSTSLCKCADGFYQNSNLLYQCFPCETKLCGTCAQAKPAACTSCISGATLSIFDSTCSCSTGFYENNGTCSRCPAKCGSCAVSSSCTTCADVNRDSGNNCSCIAGYYDAGVDKCAACNSNCATCSSATSCVSCDARKFRVLNNTLCVCQDGFFQLVFANGTKVCTPCSSECKKCSQSAGECSDCDASVNRVQGYDSLGHRTCICKPGYHAVTNGGCIQSNCKSDKWCSQCEADLALCIQCQANVNRVIKLPQHICVCADGYYEAADGTCKICSDGCAKCSSATNCTACVAQSTSNSDGTCKCANGTFFGASANGVRYCQQCIQYCERCSNGLTCTACKTAFVLSVDNTCVCPKNNYINSRGECVPCKAGCETCLTNTTCDKCINPLVLEQNNCIPKCSAGYFLSGAKCIGCPKNCVGCTTNNQCYYCKDGFYLHGGACYSACPAGTVANNGTFQCIPCNNPCRTCTNHPSSCTSCDPAEGFLQITGTDQKCVKQCAEGTFPKDGVCQVCDFRCAKCLGAPGNCIACPVGKYLYNAACWDYCPGVTDGKGNCVNKCDPGYFRLSDQQCKQCSPQCKTCTSATQCQTCANNFVQLNGKCVKQCGAGFYTFRGYCVACDKSCKTCVNNPTQCTSCADNYISSNGRCVSTCSTGQYLDAVSKSCRQCASTCATCSSQQFCSTCPNDKIAPVGGQCLPCIYPCATCSSDLSVCQSCLSGFSLSNGDCVRTCPSGTRSVNGVCGCSSGLFLDGSCVSSCPSGYTKVGTNCQRCESPCTECAGSSSFCTDCLDTYTIKSNGKCQQSSTCNYGQIQDNGKCSRSCDVGLYFQNGVCIFGGCLSGFKDNGFGGCVSTSVNTGRCESPTFKLNGACTDNCGNGFFPNSFTRTCDACSANCQSCLNIAYCLACASGFSSVDGRCVAQSKCTATQFSYNGACLNICPVGTNGNSGRCVRSCPAGSFFFNNWCYSTCPTEAQYATDNSCVATCPSGTTLIDNVCATIV